jgi:hypothetical protein
MRRRIGRGLRKDREDYGVSGPRNRAGALRDIRGAVWVVRTLASITQFGPVRILSFASANPRITMEIYQQTITPERREAQAKAFDELLTGNNTRFSGLSRDRTLPNPHEHDWIRPSDHFRVKRFPKVNSLKLKRTDGSESAQKHSFWGFRTLIEPKFMYRRRGHFEEKINRSLP